MNNKVLIKMVDGGLKEVNYDKECIYEGCETCGYGGRWLNNISITMLKGYINIEVPTMYSYDNIDENDFMRILTSNIDKISKMKQKEFAKWLKEQIIEIYHGDYEDEIKIYYKELV